MPDSDAWGSRDSKGRLNFTCFDPHAIMVNEVNAVMLALDSERFTQFSRSVGKQNRMVDVSSRDHAIDTFDGFDGSDQNGGTSAFDFTDDIHAP